MTVVYRLYDATGALLYIGCSRNLPARIKAHRCKPWGKSVRFVLWEPGDFDLEAYRIRTMAPLHNVRHMPPRERSPLLLTVTQAAQRLGVTPNRVRNMADAGSLPCYRFPSGHRRFHRDEIEPFRVAS